MDTLRTARVRCGGRHAPMIRPASAHRPLSGPASIADRPRRVRHAALQLSDEGRGARGANACRGGAGVPLPAAPLGRSLKLFRALWILLAERTPARHLATTTSGNGSKRMEEVGVG
jgi:hypothetical protein